MESLHALGIGEGVEVLELDAAVELSKECLQKRLGFVFCGGSEVSDDVDVVTGSRPGSLRAKMEWPWCINDIRAVQKEENANQKGAQKRVAARNKQNIIARASMQRYNYTP